MDDSMFNMDKKILNNLFKPYKVHKKRFIDFLDDKTKRNFFKHKVWFECSKSIDESCINVDCEYNLIKMHDDEQYVELFNEIQNERI